MPQKKVDWQAVERDYRLGQLTDTELAESHGVGRGSMLRKAKREGWKRDLSAQVRGRTRAALIDHESSGVGESAADSSAVDRAVAGNVEVIRRHQLILEKSRQFAQSILSELQEATDNRADIEEAILDETVGDKGMKRRTQMLKAVSAPARAAAGNQLSSMIRNLIAGERRAYDLDEPGKGDGEGGSGAGDGKTNIVIVPAKEGGSEPIVKPIEQLPPIEPPGT